MNKICVEPDTLINLSKVLKNQNTRLLEIVSDITNITSKYEDMLISDAGELFKKTIIKDQEDEKNKILLNNVDIGDRLLSFANIYQETNDKIKELVS